jgi:transposase
MRTITLNPKQQRHVEILTRLEAGALDVATAAESLGVGVRQIRRQRVRFRQDGMAAVIHGNCGRRPVNRTDPALVAQILALAGPDGKYHDLNVCRLQGFLDQKEQIVIGRFTLDRLFKQAGLRQQGALGPGVHSGPSHFVRPQQTRGGRAAYSRLRRHGDGGTPGILNVKPPGRQDHAGSHGKAAPGAQSEPLRVLLSFRQGGALFAVIEPAPHEPRPFDSRRRTR